MRARLDLSIALTCLTGGLFGQASYQADEVETTMEYAAPSETLHFKPRLSFGYGALEYRELKFDPFVLSLADPPRTDVKSDFDEAVYQGSVNFDFIFGHHGMLLGFDFFQTESGTEKWKDEGVLFQENDLDVWRFGFEVGYIGSTYNRSIPPAELTGADRWIRFAGGLAFYYRHQHFTRDEFVVFNPNVIADPTPSFSDEEVEEQFDMVGGEILLELEAGPRNIVAAFVRARGGGGLVTVVNDSLGSLEEDARIYTAGVQGTFDVGIVSQFVKNLELRAGYRFGVMQVYEERAEVDLGGGTLYVDLPDNRTMMSMAFVELAIPF